MLPRRVNPSATCARSRSIRSAISCACAADGRAGTAFLRCGTRTGGRNLSVPAASAARYCALKASAGAAVFSCVSRGVNDGHRSDHHALQVAVSSAPLGGANPNNLAILRTMYAGGLPGARFKILGREPHAEVRELGSKRFDQLLLLLEIRKIFPAGGSVGTPARADGSSRRIARASSQRTLMCPSCIQQLSFAIRRPPRPQKF